MLLMDLGNTALKCRWPERGAGADKIFPLINEQGWKDFATAIHDYRVESVYLASVAGDEVTAKVLKLLASAEGVKQVQRLVSHSELSGLTNAYQDYLQLGVDRWLTLVAGYDPGANDCIIIDGGSAITIDLLSQQGGHQGGAILPGFNTGPERFVSMFPAIDFKQVSDDINRMPGRSTLECLMPVNEDRLAVIRVLLDNWSGILEAPVDILLCGQDLALLDQGLPMNCRAEPDLVFQGMLKQIEFQR